MKHRSSAPPTGHFVTEHRPTRNGHRDTWNAEEAQVEVVPPATSTPCGWALTIPTGPIRAMGATWSNATMIIPIGLTPDSPWSWPAMKAPWPSATSAKTPAKRRSERLPTYATDAFNETPLLTTVQLNAMDDPFDTLEDCGYNRCGGLGDFLTSASTPKGARGSPAHNISGKRRRRRHLRDLHEGPSLRGANITMLAPMPAGARTL